MNKKDFIDFVPVLVLPFSIASEHPYIMTLVPLEAAFYLGWRGLAKAILPRNHWKNHEKHVISEAGGTLLYKGKLNLLLQFSCCFLKVKG